MHIRQDYSGIDIMEELWHIFYRAQIDTYLDGLYKALPIF